jgi:uncharacterized glyoxalase superfamily protein PhnB
MEFYSDNCPDDEESYSDEEREIDDLILRLSLGWGPLNYRLKSITPVIYVHNLIEAISFYEEKLGFMKTPLDEKPLNKFMYRDEAELILCSTNSIDKSTGYYYMGCSNIDALYAEYQSRNVNFLMQLTNTEWEGKGFKVKDISGNTLHFSDIYLP